MNSKKLLIKHKLKEKEGRKKLREKEGEKNQIERKRFLNTENWIKSAIFKPKH